MVGGERGLFLKCRTVAGPNDEERGQPHVPNRESLARSSSSLSFAFGQLARMSILRATIPWLRGIPAFLLACSALAMVGCSGNRTTPAAPASGPLVGVAGFTWDQREEQEEVRKLLTTNGIPAVFNGSIHVGVSVSRGQAGLALALLKTNHLVTTGKIVLLME